MLSCSKPCAARREDGCFAELTWNILDDLPILDGRSHLGVWHANRTNFDTVADANCDTSTDKYLGHRN